VWDNFDRRQKAKAANDGSPAEASAEAGEGSTDPDMFGHAGVAAE
jgi:hypothetical protein